MFTDQPPSIVIMQLDQRLDVAPLPVSAVHELPGLLQAKAYVVAASPPLPLVRLRRRRRLGNLRPPATRFWCALIKEIICNYSLYVVQVDC